MERFITDERTGLKYELVGDYPNPPHFITIKAQTMAFWGKPRRPVASLGSVSRSTLWRMLHKEK